MPRPAHPLPPELQGNPFSVGRARFVGVGSGRLRRADLESPRRGVRVPAGTVFTVEGLARYVLSRYPDAVVSHMSAARFWGFPLPGTSYEQAGSGLLVPVRHGANPGTAGAAAPPDLDVTLPPQTTRLRWEGVRAHRSSIAEDDIVVADGLRVTSIERTWYDLTTELDEPWGVVIGDHLLREPRFRYEGRISPLATIGDLERVVDERRGKRGRRAAVRALGLARVGADSPQETRLRLALVQAGMPEPLLNRHIRDESGARHHEPDMQWPRWKVCAEYEGATHREGVQIERDIDRADRARTLGGREVRLTSRDAADDWTPAVHKVRMALHERGWHGA